jgi:hypothetical protein
MFDPTDYNEREESKISQEPDWYTRNNNDLTPYAATMAWARAMKIAQRAHDAAELGATGDLNPEYDYALKADARYPAARKVA